MMITRRSLMVATYLISIFPHLVFSMEERNQTDLAQAEIMIKRIQERLDQPAMLDQAALDKISNDLKLLKETTHSPNRLAIINELQKDLEKIKNKHYGPSILSTSEIVITEGKHSSLAPSSSARDQSVEEIEATQAVPLSISQKFLLGFYRYHASHDVRTLASLVLLVPAVALALKTSLEFIESELQKGYEVPVLLPEDLLPIAYQPTSCTVEGLIPPITKACSSKPKDAFSPINTMDDEHDFTRFAALFGAGGLTASVILRYVFGR